MSGKQDNIIFCRETLMVITYHISLESHLAVGLEYKLEIKR